MSIIRAPRPEAGYYALDRKVAEDERLSWAARGLLVFLLVKPDHWRVSIEHLRRQTEAARVSTGRDGIYALLGELEAAGYMRRHQPRGEDGRLVATEYLVAEAPLPDLPDTAGPQTALPFTAETTLGKKQKAGKKQGSTTQGAREKSGPAPIIELPEWVPQDLWAAWLEVRRKIRAPNTAQALRLNLNKLDALRQSGQHPAAVLEQAISRGWRGLFPLKDPANDHDHRSDGRRLSAVERVKRANDAAGYHDA